MADRILVTYGSWCGSTAEVAEAIGKALAEGGADVDVMPASRAGDLQSYSAVVVGTAIRAGRCKGEVTKFVRAHQEALRRLPTALFSLGMQMQEDSEENRAKAAAFLGPLASMMEPVAIGLFGPKVDANRASFPLNLVIKAMPQGDWRDWGAIRAWADGLRPLLAARRS